MVNFHYRTLSGVYRVGIGMSAVGDYIALQSSLLELSKDLPAFDTRITTLENLETGILGTLQFLPQTIPGSAIMTNSMPGDRILDNSIPGSKIVTNSLLGLTDANLSPNANINPSKINLSLLSHTQIADIGILTHPQIDTRIGQLFADVGSTPGTPLTESLQSQVTDIDAAIVTIENDISVLENFVVPAPLGTTAQTVSAAINELVSEFMGGGPSGSGIIGPAITVPGDIAVWKDTQGRELTQMPLNYDPIYQTLIGNIPGAVIINSDVGFNLSNTEGTTIQLSTGGSISLITPNYQDGLSLTGDGGGDLLEAALIAAAGQDFVQVGPDQVRIKSYNGDINFESQNAFIRLLNSGEVTLETPNTSIVMDTGGFAGDMIINLAGIYTLTSGDTITINSGTDRYDTFGNGYIWYVNPGGGASYSQWYDDGGYTSFDHEFGPNGYYIDNTGGFSAWGGGSNLSLSLGGDAELYGESGIVRFRNNILQLVADPIDDTDALNLRTANLLYPLVTEANVDKLNVGQPLDTSATVNIFEKDRDGTKVREIIQGGGTPVIYTPATIFGVDLLAWWKTQDLTGSDGDPKSTLLDSSGNGYDLTTQGILDPPLLATDSISGNKYLNFGSGEKDLQNTTIPFPTMPFTIVTIVRPDPAFSFLNAIISNPDRSMAVITSPLDNHGNGNCFGIWSRDAAGFRSTGNITDTSKPYCLVNRFLSTSSKIGRTDSRTPVSDGDVNSQWGNGIVFGHLITDDGLFQGYIGESFVVSRDLTADEIKKVNDYAKATWLINDMVYEGPAGPQVADLTQWKGPDGAILSAIDKDGNFDGQGTATIINIPEPTDPQQAATKNYVDTTVFDTGSLWGEATTVLSPTDSAVNRIQFAGFGSIYSGGSSGFAIQTPTGEQIALHAGASDFYFENFAGDDYFSTGGPLQIAPGSGVLKFVLTKLNISGLPTSPAGLSAGDVYSNGGVLTIV